MPRRPPNPGAQQVEPQGLPRDGARRRRDPLLPRLPLPQLRSVLGAGSPGGLRASEGGGAWWPSGSSHPDVRHPSPRLPAPPTLAQRGAQNRTRLRSLLLPPLPLARASRELAPRRRGPGEREDPRRGAAREAPDSLRALLGELLPSRFREFLHHLGAECAEPRPPKSWASRPKRSVSDHSHHAPQCPHCQFLPDLRGQSSYVQNSLKKILLHQIPALGTLRRDPSQFTLKKANHRPHGAQAPRLKAVLSHSSSGQSSGQRKRFCPFRVRFADETLRDTALRYWERSCAAWPLHFSGTGSPRASKSFHLFIDQLLCAVSGNVAAPEPSCGPAGYRRAWASSPVSIGTGARERPEMTGEFAQNPVRSSKEEAMANVSFSWDRPGLSTQEPPGHLPEDASMKRSLPSIPRATTRRLRGDLPTWQDMDDILGLGGHYPAPGARRWNPSRPAWSCTQS
ncbi:uncharacterized protein C9orf50 homolog isoform X1 [Mustela putorius furo]|uniref:Uncharacterized protein C9orf50 homolog isoform X1 n=1 Tax=Mustela putorius furo TaxID=9669 RepID=A0A8U0NW15_MUSPF|nr:uncharacterized protein C9orf50 homolog isoform X1 [Mustela putorius furo]